MILFMLWQGCFSSMQKFSVRILEKLDYKKKLLAKVKHYTSTSKWMNAMSVRPLQ